MTFMVYQDKLSQLLSNSGKVSAVLSSLIEQYSKPIDCKHPDFTWLKRKAFYLEVWSPNPIYHDFAKWVGKELCLEQTTVKLPIGVLVTSPDDLDELCNDRWKEIIVTIAMPYFFRNVFSGEVNEMYASDCREIHPWWNEFFPDKIVHYEALGMNYYQCYEGVRNIHTHLKKGTQDPGDILAQGIIRREGELVGLPHVES